MKKLLIVGAVGAIAIGGYSYANYYVSKEARKGIDQQLMQIQTQTGLDIRYDEISANVLDNALALADISVNDHLGEQIAQIERVEMTGYEPNKISEYSRVEIKDLTFSGAAVQGMDELKGENINVLSEFTYDEKSGDADIFTKLNAGKLADVEFSFAMTNSQALMAVSQQFNEMQQQSQQEQGNLQQQLALQSQIMSAVTELVPKKVSFKLANNGKLKALLERLVGEQGMTYEQFQQNAQQQLSMSPAPVVLREAALNFIEGTEQFEVSMQVPENTSVAEINQQMMTLMGKPEELANYFSLHAVGK